MLNVWRVNIGRQDMVVEKTPDSWTHLGGRGLLARVLLDEVTPTCDPLGPRNKLVFAPGLLVGHILSSCDRISIGAKSPLTGGVKEANAGGSTGMQLSLLGIKALIIEGFPEKPGLWILYLSKDGAKFLPADELKGLGVYASAEKIIRMFTPKVGVALIGPGGEMKMRAAGIQNLDKDLVPSRIAARGGLGAVMGSKNLKAIVFDTEGCDRAPIVHQEAFKEAHKEFNQALLSHTQTQVFADYGTAGIGRMANGFGALPTRNFKRGEFKGFETISGEYLRETILNRSGEGETTHACMAGCIIRCSNVYAGKEGKSIVSPLEYETIGLMGANLEIDDLDTIAQLNFQANDIGLDSIEIGAALGVAAEAGIFDFGDGKRALELMDEIRSGSVTGKMLGNGVKITGDVLGVSRVPQVKGQAISAYDPRAIKGTGVTYATSPQGADHTCGLTIRAKVDHTDPAGQVELSRNAQINNAGYDTLGACVFAGFGFGATPGTIGKLLNARYDWEVKPDILQVLGRETLKLEKEFNLKAGFSKFDDRLPEYMTTEPIEPTNAIFDVPEDELDTLFNW